jgi:hypothetical protein
VSLTALFKGEHLAVKSRIDVSIVKAGWIGESFVFTIRSNHQPLHTVACLSPGGSEPVHGC